MDKEVLINTKIDNINRENRIYKFTSELEYLLTNNHNSERIPLLREILKILQNNNDDKELKARENITNLCNKLTENQLKKKWVRLTLDYKIDQIKKYCLEKFENNEERVKIQEKILKLLEEGKLKQNLIEYNEKIGKIINIEYEIKEHIKKKKPKKEESSSDSE
jgi:hypothetical protein